MQHLHPKSILSMDNKSDVRIFGDKEERMNPLQKQRVRKLVDSAKIIALVVIIACLSAFKKNVAPEAKVTASLPIASEFDKLLERCSYNRVQICDDDYMLCYYLTYPSFLHRDYPDENNDYKNVFSDGRYMTIETWELWNHIEVDYDSNDVYKLLKSSTDTYHFVKNNMVVVSGIYYNGMKYYTKAVFDKEDNVIYCKITYSADLSKKSEEQLIQQIFKSFPN